MGLYIEDGQLRSISVVAPSNPEVVTGEHLELRVGKGMRGQRISIIRGPASSILNGHSFMGPSRWSSAN